MVRWPTPLTFERRFNDVRCRLLLLLSLQRLLLLSLECLLLLLLLQLLLPAAVSARRRVFKCYIACSSWML